MTILDNFLKENCSEEQSSLLIFCFETLSRLGFVEIEFNIDELLGMIEDMDLFETLQCCYQYIRKFQNMAFDALEIKVDNEEDIARPNDLLVYLDQLEDSPQHSFICNIIENASCPEDAFIRLLEDVLFVDVGSFLPIVHHVPGSLMERLYAIHKTDIDLTALNTEPLKKVDGRKLEVLKKLWAAREINPLRQTILGEINLPISKTYYLQIMGKELKNMRVGGFDKKHIARKLLEGCLVMDIEWKDLKKGMRSLASEIFDDLLFTTELAYAIDNVCMEWEINGAF